MKTSYLLFLVILIITSCSKTDQRSAQDLRGEYQTKNTIKVEPLVMYVKDKKITDSSIINTYLRQNNFLDSFTYNRTEILNHTLLKIKFGNNDSANFTINDPAKLYYGDKIFMARKFSLSDNEILIKRYDSSMIFIDINDPNSVSCDSAKPILKDYSLQYKFNYNYPQNNVTLVSFGGFPLSYKNGMLLLSFFNIYNNGGCNNGSSTYRYRSGLKNLWGIKRNDIGQNMPSRDTLVIQEKCLSLYKVP